jgi:hypothetical protein
MEIPVCPVPHDWSRYSLDQIAAMLRRQSPEAGQAAVTMWTAIETLCQELADRLRKALKDLEARWPTGQQAADAFQMWGASLARAMDDTAETARRNRPVAANLNEEINRARARIDELMSQRARYQELEQSRGSLIANAAHVGNELLDGDLDFTGWRSALDRDAREVMASLEQKIYNYASDLYADRLYEPPVGPVRDMLDVRPGDGLTSIGVADGFLHSSGGWSGVWEPSDSSTMSGRSPVPASEPALPRGSGPDGNPTPVTGSGPGGDTVLDGLVPGPGSGAAGAPPTGPGGAFLDTPWGRVLAPGGVIGAPVTGGIGVGPTPGGPNSATAPAAAGLVSTTGSATRAAGGPGLVPLVPPMVPGRAGSGTASSTGGRRSRPGLPGVFDTPEGPPGVIQPPAEPAEHHPGPGVIGIDR